MNPPVSLDRLYARVFGKLLHMRETDAARADYYFQLLKRSVNDYYTLAITSAALSRLLRHMLLDDFEPMINRYGVAYKRFPSALNAGAAGLRKRPALGGAGR